MLVSRQLICVKFSWHFARETTDYQQGQLLEGVECHIYLYCFTFDDINLNRAFVIIVLIPKNIAIRKRVQMIAERVSKALGIY